MVSGLEIWELLVVMGVPTGFTGILIWWFKKTIDEREARAEEKEKNTENLMLMLMQTTRATNVLAEATARAVQRIPDAHCNGDMEAALKQAAEIQKQEKDFLFDQGIKRIFGD